MDKIVTNMKECKLIRLLIIQLDELKDFIAKIKPDILSINETKCNHFTAFNHFIINNYKLLHKERPNQKN